MIENIYILSIFTGVIIILVSLYFKKLANKASKATLEIIELNEKLKYDPYKFINEVFRHLKKIKIEDYSYEVVFGPKFERKKTTQKTGISKSFIGNDYSIYIEIVPKKFKWERRYIYLIILETLFLLLKIDILIKIKTVNETFSNIARLQTYIQHDIKNIAQFIQALSHNIQNVKTPEGEHIFIKYLKESSHAISLKANNIINMLEIKPEKGESMILLNEIKKYIDIRRALEDLAKFYNLRCKIKGNAFVYAEEGKVILIFDNLFKNIYDKSLQENIKCSIEIYEDNDSVIATILDTGSHIEDIQRIFEPFYTTKNAGLGIGLYQVKNLLVRMGGKIEAKNTEDGVRFNITMPKTISLNRIGDSPD